LQKFLFVFLAAVKPSPGGMQVGSSRQLTIGHCLILEHFHAVGSSARTRPHQTVGYEEYIGTIAYHHRSSLIVDRCRHVVH